MKKVLHYLSIMNRARGFGHFFPSREDIAPSPKGTHEAPTQGHFGKRLSQEVHWFRHSTHHLTLADWPSLHILHLTDLHIRNEGDFLDRVINEVRGLTPDLIVLTGDLITKGWTHRAIEHFLSALPDVPKVAVLGNWEHWVVGNLTDWQARLHHHNITLLVDEWLSLQFNDTIVNIVGTDDHLAGHSDLQTLCQDIPTGPALCLTHSPGYFDQLCQYPLDLILAGHAHGGQIRLPKLGALWVPRGTKQYVAGWYQQNESHLFVSRGLGWSVAPIRLQCPPEVAHIFINHSHQ